MAYRSAATRDDGAAAAPPPDPATVIWVVRYGIGWLLVPILSSLAGFVMAAYEYKVGRMDQAAYGLGIGVVFVVFLLLIRFRHRLELDPASGEIRVKSSAIVASPAPRAHHAHEVAFAKKEDIDDSNFACLVLFGKDEKPLDRVIGDPDHCVAGARAINGFLRDLADDRKPLEPKLKSAVEDSGGSLAGRKSPFAGWRRELDDDARRALVERFLGAIDPAGKILRKKEDLELHATRDGLAYRVVVSATSPYRTVIHVPVATGLHFTLTREDEKPSVYSGKGHFARVPHDLQERIRALYTEQRLGRFYVRHDEVEVSTENPPTERRDPVSEILAILTVVFDTATFVATIPEEEEEEEEEEEDEDDQGSG